MLKTYEIRKVPCSTKPDLWKFNMECKEKINKELDISDDKIINTSPSKVLDFLESRGHKPIVEMRNFFNN